MIHFSYYSAKQEETIEMQTDLADVSVSELCEMFERFLLAMGYVLPENSSIGIIEDDEEWQKCVSCGGPAKNDWCGFCLEEE